MKYIDIHTHTAYQHKDVITVQNLFSDSGITPGKEGFYSIGLHPWHVANADIDTQMEQMKKWTALPNVIAIGETGLDKTIDCPWKKQQEAFEMQLAMAEEMRKPVILHCVRAYSEMLAYRKRADHSIPWIFHWFNGSIQLARDLISKNCYLSFGHMLFKMQSKAYNSFKDLHTDHIFFETDDAGYSITEIYERASEVKKVPVGALKTRISANFTRCFQWING